MIGETVGSYRIVSRLGVGGMGAVYRAEHQLLGRAVAVKLLLPELTANRDITQRFFNEARATTAIKHPGIVEVFDFGYLPSGHAFIVMELLDGVPLTQRIRARGRMAEGEACALLRDVCSALAAAHDKGIVHRDLKPDNIFIVPDLEHGERIKILDFGIAKLTDIGLAGSATKTGAVMGTPTYMSPEQCKGSGAVDHRADLYSIGCMLYELVAGRPPFVRDGAGELIGSHLFVEPEPPSRHVAISPELDALIMTLLAKDPAQRVQTARELAQRLLQIAQGHGYAADVRMSGVDLARNPSYASLPAHRTPAHYTPAQLTPAHYTPAHYTPAHQAATQHAPAHYTPAHLTPPPHDAPAHRTPAPTTAPAHGQPTTLSGAASQTLPPPPPSKRRLGIVLASVAIAAAAGIGIVVTTSGGSNAKAREGTPASSPAAPTPTKPGDTKPADTEPTAPTEPKPADTRPADTDIKPADTETATTQAVDSKPVDGKPTDGRPTDSKPIDSKPSASADAKPADTKPADAKPSASKAADTTPTQTKPTDTKPMTSKPNKPSRPSRPTKPKSDKPLGDLLETDL